MTNIVTIIFKLEGLLKKRWIFDHSETISTFLEKTFVQILDNYIL